MLALVIALVVALTLSPARAQAPNGRAPGDPLVLRVGTFADNRPWVFRDEEGRLVGFEVDLVRALAGELGRRADFTAMPFKDLLPALGTGSVDLVVCSISVTPERRARIDFTQPYYETSQAVVVLKKARIRSLADLAGKTVTATTGTTNEQWLLDNRSRYRFGPAVMVGGLDEGLSLLQNGGADAYFGDLPALLYSLLTRPDLAVAVRLPTDDRYAVALAHGSALTPRVDAALATLKRNGTLAAIHHRWFGSAPPQDSPVTTELPRP
nr:transporter substrate-binding domain-containing protein [Ancylobacter tetraedralis]